LFTNFSLIALFPYSLAILFSSFTPGFALAPFLLKNLPHELLFGKSLILKIISAPFYGILVTYGGLSVLATFLSVLILVENSIILTNQLSGNNGLMDNSLRNFSKRCHGHRVAQILLCGANTIVSLFE